MKRSLKAKLLTTSIIIMAAYGTAANAASAGSASTGSNTTPKLDPSKYTLNGPLGGGIKSITRSDNETDVVQSANVGRIYWSSIDTAQGETLRFFQPNSNSVVINEVTSGMATNFLGNLVANGHVVIQNDAGIIFGKDSHVNVGALTLTTAKTILNYSDYSMFKDFSSGAGIELDGEIKAPSGYVNVLAQKITVGKTASISADKGNVNLAAGSNLYNIDLKGDGKILYSAVDLKSSDINVLGSLRAKSGKILIQARASDIASGVINLNGAVDSQSLSGQPTGAGSLTVSSSGDVNVGTDNQTDLSQLNIHADSSGHVSLSGRNVTVENTRVDTDSFDIKASGNTHITDIVVGGKTANVTSKGDTVIDGGLIYAEKGITLKSGGNTDLDVRLDTRSEGAKAGNITITSAGDLNSNGTLQASAVGDKSGNAGAVSLTSGGDLNLTGDIETMSKAGNGGNVSLKAKGTVADYSQITTASKGTGGSVTVSAKNIDMGAQLDTSGKKGGNITLVATDKFIDEPGAEYYTFGDTAGNITIKGDIRTYNNDANSQLQAHGRLKDGKITINGKAENY